MHDPLLGTLSLEAPYGWYASQPRPFRFLGGRCCRVVLDGYDDDPRPEEVRAALQRMLDASPELLSEATPHVVQYCERMLALYDDDDRPHIVLDTPGAVWSH